MLVVGARRAPKDLPMGYPENRNTWRSLLSCHSPAGESKVALLLLGVLLLRERLRERLP